MKINLFSAYITAGIAGSFATLFATGFIVGDRIRERELQAKKLKALEEIIRQNSGSKVEYLLNPQLFGKA